MTGLRPHCCPPDIWPATPAVAREEKVGGGGSNRDGGAACVARDSDESRIQM
jgi:hypothetical protein